MNTNDINRLRVLLEGYYAATLSDGERAELRRLLDEPEQPAGFAPDREAVRSLDSFIPPEGFDERLEAHIESLAASGSAKGRMRPLSLRWQFWGAAAAVAVLLGVGLTLNRPHKHPSREMTPEEAYAHVDKALTIFADALNKGYESIEKAEDTTGKATAKAFAALSRLSENSETNNSEQI